MIVPTKNSTFSLKDFRVSLLKRSILSKTNRRSAISTFYFITIVKFDLRFPFYIKYSIKIPEITARGSRETFDVFAQRFWRERGHKSFFDSVIYKKRRNDARLTYNVENIRVIS